MKSLLLTVLLSLSVGSSALRFVPREVIGDVHQFEVRNPIVGLVPVDVVHDWMISSPHPHSHNFMRPFYNSQVRESIMLTKSLGGTIGVFTWQRLSL